MKGLTYSQHYTVLCNLVKIAETIPVDKIIEDNLAYKSLMICFLLKELSISRTLITLYNSNDTRFFPASVGYILCRTMLELDINAHYLSKKPIVYSKLYIDYKKILKMKKLDFCKKHLNTKKNDWNIAMNMEWHEYWENIEGTIQEEFNKVVAQYSKPDKKGKKRIYQNWSGKNIRELAEEVDHLESYDYFYTYLSSFIHGDIEEIDRFLKIGKMKLTWSLETNEFDIGNVFRNASTFLHCFLSLFGAQFKLWEKETVDNCWNV